jgi:hypothetical protein
LLTPTKCAPHKNNFGASRKWSAHVFVTSRKHTILPSLAIWCATPDSCRSLSGSVLPVAAARVVLPLCLQGLDRQQITAAIKSAPLGRVDRKIALLRYVERLPLPDIATQTHYSRTAVGYRLKSIEKILDV